MPGKCRVCEHPERRDIERALVHGIGTRTLGRWYPELGRHNLKRHLHRCETLEEANRREGIG